LVFDILEFIEDKLKLRFLLLMIVKPSFEL